MTNGIGDGIEEEVEEEKLNDDNDDGDDNDGTGDGDAEEVGSGDIVAVSMVVDFVVFVVSSTSVFATMLSSNRMAACTKT